MAWIKACEASSVSLDQPYHAKINGIDIGIYQIDEDFYALENICPHAYALLTQGFIEDGTVECPLHEAIFEIKTGKLLKGPECRNLKQYPLKKEQTSIFVKIEE